LSTIESSARRRPHRSLPHRATPATVSPRPKANLGTRTDTRNRVRTDPVDEAGSVTLRVEHGVRAAVDVALLGRFYERFADHAVEVGRRVVLMVTGALPPRMTSAPTERRTPGRPPSAWRSRSLRRPKRPHRPGFANPLDPAPGWLDLRPGRVLHGSATPSASPSRLGVPGRPRSSPRSQSPKATQPPGPATRPVGVGESCWGVGRRPRAFLWLAQTRRQARLDGNPCPSADSVTCLPSVLRLLCRPVVFSAL
jgi:hypothetical protein